MNAFVTGSHAYGTPRPDSDIDLAVSLTPSELWDLARQADSRSGSCDKVDSLMFGRLNLICLSEPHFAAWKAATEELVARRTVSREEAIEAIERKIALINESL